MRQKAIAAAIIAALLLAGGCGKSPDVPAPPSAAAPPQALPDPVVDDQPVVLEAVMEGTSDYIGGNSYQGDAAKYQGLAKNLEAYAGTESGERGQDAQSTRHGEAARSGT